MKHLLPVMLLLPLGSCIFHPPGLSTANEGPFIDSIGYDAAQARIETIDREEGNALLSQALSVPDDSLQTAPQPAFFQSIEESYQRYLKLFTPVKKALRPEIRCSYDLVETFRLRLFDPQPFMNALLHTMSLTQISTLDFTVEPKNTDTTLIYVSLTQAVSQQVPQGGTKWVTFSDGDLILSVTRHSAILMTPMP